MGVRRRVGILLVVAVAVVAGGCTAQPSTSAVPSSPPVTPTSTPTPTPTLSPTQPALELGGVFVPVPARMLDPRHVRCGVAIKDAAHVVDPADPVDACAVTVDAAHITEVVLRPIRPVAAWADGRSQEVRTFRERGVQLIVTSPSAARAQALADGAFVVDDPDGCPLRAAELGPAPEPTTLGPVVPDGASATTVCGYRRGRLTQSQTLTAGQSRDLSAALRAAPTVGVVRPCPYLPSPPKPVGFWVAMLDDGSRVWQQRMECVDVVVADDGTFAGLTGDLGQQLWTYAQGPASWTSTP